jgi:acyl-CoA synthetase (AMP-forming)/AMP-acid ligase II
MIDPTSVVRIPVDRDRSIAEIVQQRAKWQGEDTALIYLRDGEDNVESCTYRELWERSSRIAAALEAREAAGKRAILLYEPGIEYVAAFLGTMASGVIAVPAYPPVSPHLAERLRGVMLDCLPGFVLTTAMFSAGFRSRVAGPGNVEWIETDQLKLSPCRGVDVNASDLAMLQYTSGSTGTPKGVMMSHHNIVANCAAVHEWLGPDPHRRGCIWLPPYHDMGLLGGILQPLYSGFPLVFMSPLHFVQRPVRWLRAISKYRITLSGGPNFSYQMCASSISDADLAGLDLSSWREAFCGAEPVRRATLTAFCQRFAAVGFSTKAFNPCYGLAESTLIVTGKPSDSEPTYGSFDRGDIERGRVTPLAADAQPGGAIDATWLTSCGIATGGADLRIVDPETLTVLGPGQVGRIWIAGPSVAQGYWNRPEDTRATFGCTLPGVVTPFLDTGDLGFIHDGQLYVTGRAKDLIIIGGRNHYAEDIEHTVEGAHGAVSRGGAVAFSVDTNVEEAIVVVAELRAMREPCDTQKVAEAIVTHITSRHGVVPKAVMLCKRGAIARTTSGKVRRAASRARYLAGDIKPLAESRPL